MPLDTTESFEDALKGINFAQKFIAVCQKLPQTGADRPRYAADYAPLLTLVATDLLPLADQVIADVKD